MDGVTLLESGASRAHFALVKQLESAGSAKEADEIVRKAIDEARRALGSKSSVTFSESFLVSQLLIVLHCFNVYPHTFDAREECRLDATFAYVPALHLLAIAQHAKGLQVAYSLLAVLYGPSSSSSLDKEASALLLLNTVRQHLSRTGASTSAKPSKAQRLGSASHSIEHTRKLLALRSIISGLPSGADTVPALYGPIYTLLSDSDESIQSRAVEALLIVASYRDDDEDAGMARAMWEHVKTICFSAIRRTAKRKLNEGKSERMHRALLKGAEYALRVGAIDVNEFVDTLHELTQDECSSWLHQKVVRAIGRGITSNRLKVLPEGLEKVFTWTAQICTLHRQSYPLSIEVAELNGECAALSVGSKAALETAQVIWQHARGHLGARNANRKIVALRILDALLPLGWASPADGEAKFQLDEEEMTMLLETLKDNDDSVRQCALRLFHKVDVSILRAHLDALMLALESQDLTDSPEQIAVRAVETLGVLCADNQELLTSIYVARLNDLLKSKHLHAILSDILIAKVVAHWQVAGSVAKDALVKLLCRLEEGDNILCPMATLLVATLVCELFASAEDEAHDTRKECLLHLAQALPRIDREAVPLQEALLVAMIRLALLCTEAETVGVDTLLAKYAETSSSSMVKERIKQFTSISKRDPINSLRSASLLVTLDTIEGYLALHAQGSLSPTSDDVQSGLRKKAKPLQYNAYEAPSPTSASKQAPPSDSISSYEKRKSPFQALPTPSALRGHILSNQRKHSATEQEMHRSVAHLTLAEDDDVNVVDERAEKDDSLI